MPPKSTATSSGRTYAKAAAWSGAGGGSGKEGSSQNAPFHSHVRFESSPEGSVPPKRMTRPVAS